MRIHGEFMEYMLLFHQLMKLMIVDDDVDDDDDIDVDDDVDDEVHVLHQLCNSMEPPISLWYS